MKRAGQARHAFMLAGDRSRTYLHRRRSMAGKLPEQKASLYDVGVYAELAVQWLLAPAANVRITLSSVPSGIPGPEVRRLRPRRADQFIPSPYPPAWWAFTVSA